MSKPAPTWPIIDGIRSVSVVVEDTIKPGETPTRRNALHKDALVTKPYDGISTVPDILAYCARVHGTKEALGWRDITDVHEEEKEVKKNVGGKEVTEKKKWKYFQLSEYRYLNYVEVQDAANEVASGLVELGVNKGDVFNVYAQTRCVQRFSSLLLSSVPRAASQPDVNARDSLSIHFTHRLMTSLKSIRNV